LNGTPPDPDFADDVDDRYRRASALDPSRPSEAVRSAVLEHAAKLAAQRAEKNRRWRRPAIFGTLAAAALAGLLITPRLLPPREDPRKKASESLAPRSPAPRTAEAEPPRNERERAKFVADEMRSPAAPATAATSPPPSPPVPSPSPPAPASSPPAPASSPPAPASSPEPSSPPPAGSAGPPALRASDSLAASLAQQSAFTRGLTPRAAAAAKSRTTAGAEAQPRSAAGAAAGRIDAAAALREAAQAGDTDTLQALLARQSDIGRPSDIDARDSSGRTALLLATLHGQRAAVEALLAAGADPNAADAHGTTPLQAAIAGGAQPEIIAALQRAGAH